MKNYRVGYGRVDITPQESVPLAGFGNTSMRMSRCVRDPLYASCFAITDEQDTTLILMSLDLQRGNERETRVVRDFCLQEYGIPGQLVMVAGTHTHAAPDQANFAEPSMDRYRQLLDEKLPQCVTMAMEDRREAEMFMGDVEACGMNYVRHYVHTTQAGEKLYFGDAFGTPVLDETTAHATEADPTVHIVKFVRRGAKDLVLVNFRAHGILASGSKVYDVSADLMGGIRDAFESTTDALITYFQGAAGNQNPFSRILKENITKDCRAYGQVFAGYVKQGLEHLRPVAPDLIRNQQIGLELPVNKPDAALLEGCMAVREVWQRTNDFKQSAAVGAPYGIRSPYQANAIYGRSKLEDMDTLELNAITLGELALVSAPNELFDTNSVFVEEHAPQKKVLTLGYCNDAKGYLPSRFGFEYGCYESDCCRFLPGVGEQVANTFLEMLRSLHENAF